MEYAVQDLNSGVHLLERGDPNAELTMLQAWQSGRESLLDVVARLSDEEFSRSPAPGEWSPRQQVAHVAEMERMWLGWALQVASDPGCQFGHRHQTPTPSVDAVADTSLEALLDELAVSRRTSVAALAGLSPEQWDHVGFHRWFGAMTTRQCLKGIYRHDRMHTDQIVGRPVTFTLPPLPEAALTEPGWFSVTRRIAWSETDPSGAYQFAHVLRFAEDAETALLRHAGVLAALHPRLPRIYAEASFSTPAYFDQEIDVDIALVNLGRSSMHYLFRVLRGSTICAEGRLGAAFVDEHGKSQLLPLIVRERLEPHLHPGFALTWH
jgi:acyl-CoA thioester hydrolase